METIASSSKHDFVPGKMFTFDTPKMDTPKSESFSGFFSPLKRFSIDLGACFSPKGNEVDNDVQVETRHDSLAQGYKKFDFSCAQSAKPNINFASQNNKGNSWRFTANSRTSRRLSLNCSRTPRRKWAERKTSAPKKRKLSFSQDLTLAGEFGSDWNKENHGETNQLSETKPLQRTDGHFIGRRFNSKKNKVRIVSSPTENNGRFSFSYFVWPFSHLFHKGHPLLKLCKRWTSLLGTHVALLEFCSVLKVKLQIKLRRKKKSLLAAVAFQNCNWLLKSLSSNCTLGGSTIWAAGCIFPYLGKMYGWV